MALGLPHTWKNLGWGWLGTYALGREDRCRAVPPLHKVELVEQICGLLYSQRGSNPANCRAIDFWVFYPLIGLHTGHMKVPRLHVKAELHLLDYATATEKQYLSCLCDLHHSLQECQILNPLSEARD